MITSWPTFYNSKSSYLIVQLAQIKDKDNPFFFIPNLRFASYLGFAPHSISYSDFALHFVFAFSTIIMPLIYCKILAVRWPISLGLKLMPQAFTLGFKSNLALIPTNVLYRQFIKTCIDQAQYWMLRRPKDDINRLLKPRKLNFYYDLFTYRMLLLLSVM